MVIRSGTGRFVIRTLRVAVAGWAVALPAYFAV